MFLFITACNKSTDKSDNTSNSTSIDISTSNTFTTSTQDRTIPNEIIPNEPIKPEQDFILPQSGIRPIAVMIDNEGNKPLPQGGLYKAQLIYEIIAENGDTRLMPVFWNTDATLIGPVRSARDYFLDYAIEHNALYIHFGGSPAAYSDIKKLKWNDIDGIKGRDGQIFWDLTNEGSRNWQDTYTNMGKLKSQIAKLKYKQTSDKNLLFSYNSEDFDLSASQLAEKVSITYSQVYSCAFTYDPLTKCYLRSRKNKPQIERTTKKQLTAKNIIIQNVRSTSISGDDKGRQELVDIGKGSGWFITNGKAVKLKWVKTSRTSQTKYSDEAGNPIVLNQGQTWIQIVPLSGKVTVE